jgi:transposase-like protein
MNKDTKRRKALALLETGTDVRIVAQRYGVSVRTLERWKAAASVANGDVAENDVPPLEVSDDSPEDKPNKALDDALKAAGEAPKDNKPTESDVAAAVVDKQKFCVDTINNIRLAAGTQAVKWIYSPPLNPTAPEVLALCRMDGFTEMAVRNNADKLFDPLSNLATNPYVCYVALGLSTLGMFIGISKLAEARGWEPKKKTEKPRSVPTMEQYAAQLKPKPRPEDAPVQIVPPPPTAKGPGADTIFDAPIPVPPEDVEEAE